MMKKTDRYLIYYFFLLCLLTLSSFSVHAEQRILPSHDFSIYTYQAHRGAVRILLSGIPLSRLRFDNPKEFNENTDQKAEVYHLDGGRVIYRQPSPSLFADNKPNDLLYNNNFKIKGIGEEAKPEVIAFALNIKKEVCEAVIKTIKPNATPEIPRLNSDQSKWYKQIKFISNQQKDILNLEPVYLDHEVLKAMPMGCFQSYNQDMYVFYSIIVNQ